MPVNRWQCLKYPADDDQLQVCVNGWLLDFLRPLGEKNKENKPKQYWHRQFLAEQTVRPEEAEILQYVQQDVGYFFQSVVTSALFFAVVCGEAASELATPTA